MNLIQKESEVILQTYKRQPIIFTRGRGSWLWDADGKKYLDFFSGLAVNNLGHCHPAIVKAIAAQSQELLHTSNLFYTQAQIDCAQMLIKRSFKGKVFFANSGAEANECAFKLARRWGSSFNKNKHEIISFADSFHGRTMATLTLTGQKKYQKNFDPLVEKVLYAQFNDIASVKKLISSRTAAVLIEPIQGEGGVHVASTEFLKQLKELCAKHQALLIFDEVQCGMGRSGKLFAWQHSGVNPDVMTLAKGLGGGLPIGACVIAQEYANLLQAGDHASTFGGNPVVCASARAVLQTMSSAFLKTVIVNGKYFELQLQKLKEKYPKLIKSVRGRGLILACELNFPGSEVVSACLKKQLLINCTQDVVLRFLPPLTISKKEIDSGIQILDSILKNLKK